MAIIFKRARAMQQQQRQQMVGLLIDAGEGTVAAMHRQFGPGAATRAILWQVFELQHSIQPSVHPSTGAFAYNP